MARPRWAAWLDGLVIPTSRILGRLLPRPTEAQLHTLAGRQGGPISAPDSPALAAAEHIEKGRTALQNEAFGEALHHFGQAIAQHPEAHWAWHGRGDALQLSGEPAQAKIAYTKAISIDSECGLHHAGLANALAALNDDEAAQVAWSEALALDPTLTWMRQD